MKRSLRDQYGPYVGVTDDNRLILSSGLIIGQWGDQIAVSDPGHVAMFDDFTGAGLSNAWAVHKGTDGAAANFAITAGLSGTIQGTTGATSTTMAGSGIQIDAALNFQAQNAASATVTNNLEFNTKVQVSAVAGLCIFVGLTNEAGTLQMPIQGAGGGNGFTANANNAVGFLYDTTMTTADWWGVSANGGAIVGAGQDSGSPPTAATYDVFQISIDQAGNVSFFRNKNQIGVMVNAGISPTTPLTPVIAAFSRVAASKNVLVDRIATSMNRI